MTNKPNILIVEDNEDHLHFIKKGLSDKIYNLQSIASGTDAYNYLLNPKITPDLVLLDNHLPGMSGLEILKKIGAQKKGYGFIFLTIDKSIDIIVEAMNLGAIDFIVKTPNLPYELSQKIKKIYKAKKSKLEQLKSEANFKSIIESGADAIWSIDTAYNLTAFNQSYKDSILKIYGIKIKLGYNYKKKLPKRILDFWKPYFDKALKGEKVLFESSPVYKGKHLYFEVRINPIILNGVIIGVSAISRDITKRKRNERELHQKTQLLSKHINNTPLAAIYVDTHSVIKEWNKAAENIFGHTEQEALGKNIIDLVVPKSIKGKIKSVCKTILSGNGNDINQNVNVTKQGKTILCNWYNTLITDKNNKAIGFASLVEDITERKKNEEKLEKSEQLFSAISKQSSEGITIATPKGRYVFVNPAFCKMMGYTKEALLTMTVFDVKKEKGELAKKGFIKSKSNKEGAVIEVELMRKDKSTFISEVTGKPIKIGDTNLILGIVKDITQRKEKETVLKNSEALYRSVFDNSPLGIFHFNSAGVITDSNEELTRITGASREELIGLNIFKQFTDKDMIAAISNTIKTGLGYYEGNYTSVTGHKTTPLVVHFKAIYNAENKIVGGVGLVEDVTKHKLVEEKIKQSEDILNKINSIVLVVNDKGRITYASKGVKTLLGFEPHEVLGNGWWEKTFTDLKLASERRKSALKHFFNDKTFSLDASSRQLKTKKGHSKWFDWTLSKGRGNTYIAIGLDITKRFEKNRQFKTIIKTANDAIVLANHKGKIIEWNKAATKIFGYVKKEVLGKPITKLIPQVYAKSHQKAFDESNKKGTIRRKNKTAEGLRKNGQVFPIELSLNSWQNTNNIVYCAFIKDVTEKRQLEQNFIHAFIEAQETEKQSFGEDLHDGISQILSAESMYIDVLIKLNKQPNGKIATFLDKIKALNLSAINEARSIAHGLMSKQLKENGLLKALEHICNDYNNTKNIIFKYSSKSIKESEISKEIKTNIFRITQEISTNTIRHSEATKAEVRLSKINNNQLKLVVKDNGVGIDFDKMKRENKGAGFKNIERRVKLLNGKIDIKTAPNKGTFFTITIPL